MILPRAATVVAAKLATTEEAMVLLGEAGADVIVLPSTRGWNTHMSVPLLTKFQYDCRWAMGERSCPWYGSL
jgi:hypothetical protein